MKTHLSCLLLAFLFYFPLHVDANQTATVTARTSMQSSRAPQPNPLHLFSKKKTPLALRFDGICKPLYGIRVTLRQVTSKLAIPLSVLHEEVSTNGSPLQVPSEVVVHINLPELKKQSSFELVTSARFETSDHWTTIDAIPIYAYPTELFSSATQYEGLAFVLFDDTKGLQNLFNTASIPFIDFQENPDELFIGDDEKVLLALCNIPDVQDGATTEYVGQLEEATDHINFFKKPKDELLPVLVREQENRIEVQVSNSLLTNLMNNPGNQNWLLSLIKMVAQFTRKTTDL